MLYRRKSRSKSLWNIQHRHRFDFKTLTLASIALTIPIIFLMRHIAGSLDAIADRISED